MKYLLATFLLVALLLPGVALADSDPLFVSGFETKDILEWSGVVNTANTDFNTTTVDYGDYSFDADATLTSTNFVWVDLNDADLVGSSAQATTYLKFDLNVVSGSWSSGDEAKKLVVLEQEDLGNIANITLVQTASDTFHLELTNEVTSTQIGSDFTISSGTWYRIELKTVISATVGELDMRVDGTSRASGTSLNTGTENTNAFNIGLVTNQNGQTVFIDNVTVGTADWHGDSDVLRLDPNATGAANDWNSTGGTGSNRWDFVDDIPFDTANYITNTDTGTAVESFNVEDATGTIGASDTINAVKFMSYLDGEVGGGGPGAVTDAIYEENATLADIFSSVSSAATVYSKTFATAPQSGGAWTLTKVDAVEAGADRSSGGARDTELYDVSVMVDFTVSAAPPATSPSGQHHFDWDS